MFSKVKNWLHSLISKEVAKVSVSLTKERAEAIAALKNVENEISRSFADEISAFESRIKATIEAEHTSFQVRLKATREHIGNGEPNRWKADEATLASDHALKIVK